MLGPNIRNALRAVQRIQFIAKDKLPKAIAVKTFASCIKSSKINSLYRIVNTSRYFSNIIKEPLESLGDSITTAVLLSWSKNPGDAVKEDDVIGVVETDKVTMEIRAKKSGVFVQGLVAPGAEISVGGDLYTIDTSATVAAATPSAEAPALTAQNVEATPVSASVTSKVTVPVPVMGESITQGVLAKWSVKTGDYVKADDVVASIETDKVTVDVRSPENGVISEVLSPEGSEVNVGAPLFTILTGAPAPPAGKPAVAAPAASAPVHSDTKVSTKAISSVAPLSQSTSTTLAPVSTSEPSRAAASLRTETRVKLTRMRQRIAQRLKEAQNTAAMLTTFQEVDMTNLMALRSKYKDDFEKVHGVKLGFMSAFVKAATATLQEIPAVNGVIDDATQEIVYRNYYDVSVAVASSTGLVVPVLRNTDKMTFADVEKAIAEYGAKAKKGSLALEDMAGGTFTITNGGVFGSLFSTPMINPPQSAILGMHATKMRAVVVDGKVEARPMMYLALTYDHRLIDGREAVVFLKSVAQKIEDPAKMLFVL